MGMYIAKITLLLGLAGCVSASFGNVRDMLKTTSEGNIIELTALVVDPQSPEDFVYDVADIPVGTPCELKAIRRDGSFEVEFNSKGTYTLYTRTGTSVHHLTLNYSKGPGPIL